MVVKAKFRGTTVVVKRAIPPAPRFTPLLRKPSVLSLSSASSFSFSLRGVQQQEKIVSPLMRMLSFKQKDPDDSDEDIAETSPEGRQQDRSVTSPTTAPRSLRKPDDEEISPDANGTINPESSSRKLSVRSLCCRLIIVQIQLIDIQLSVLRSARCWFCWVLSRRAHLFMKSI
jgi:hypothetical protein